MTTRKPESLEIWKKLGLFAGLSLCMLKCFSQSYTLRGTITDDEGQVLPFATIYEEGTTNGTSSNIGGQYRLQLTEGTKRIVFQHIGYQQVIKSVEVTRDISLNVALKPEALVLKEIVVSSEQKDPAYRIIREAIKKRKFYEKEVNAYSCDVYIKGVERLDKKPGSLLGIMVTLDTGIVYLSESVSKLKFEQPDKISERMISSKVSGDNNTFSYNQASLLQINLYKNQFFIEQLSERPFISPLSNNAFLYYDYKLMGVIAENGLLINKIRIIPKRPTDPVFRGVIYIIEDSWRIHSIDVMLTKDNGIEFVDSLTFRQVFAPVEHGIWMPMSQRFTFQFKAYGFEGSGYYIGIYKNYRIEPNYALFKKEDTYRKTFGAHHRKQDLFQKKDFKNAVVVVEEDAKEKDSLYWQDVRPVPLTKLEIKDYLVKDSLKAIRESAPFKDSVDRVRNRFRPGNLYFNGYTHYNSIDELYINFPTVPEVFQFNTVEGFAPELKLTITKQKDRKSIYRIVPKVKYGFANRQVQAMAEGWYQKDMKTSEFWLGGLGRYTFQFNEENPIDPAVNTFYTLVSGKNYQKMYQKTFAYAAYQKEIYNGLLINSTLTYANREPMINHNFFSFDNTPEFTPNLPGNAEQTNTAFGPHQALIFDLICRIRLNQKYIDRPDRKIVLGSPYPEFSFHYRKGIDALGSDVDYDLLSMTVNDKDIRLGLLGTSSYSVTAGMFFNTSRLTFIDFRHFNGNQTIVRQFQGESLFQLLDYYRYSTRDKFLEAHYEHHFNEFIFNKLPLIKKLNLQSVASVNFLTTPALNSHIELGAGIEHIFRFMRVDYFIALQNGRSAGSGIRVGIGF